MIASALRAEASTVVLGVNGQRSEDSLAVSHVNFTRDSNLGALRQQQSTWFNVVSAVLPLKKPGIPILTNVPITRGVDFRLSEPIREYT